MPSRQTLLSIAVLAIPFPGSAQAPQTTEPASATALGMVRTASGRPLADARVRWLPGSTAVPAWLPETASGEPVAGRTDDRGRFRFAVPPGPATCLVTTADGLGAIVPDAHSDIPLPLTLAPLARLSMEDGRAFAARARLVVAPGRTVALPPAGPADELLLPPGPWILAIEADGATFEWSRELAPGQRVTIETPAPWRPEIIADAPVLALGTGRWPPRPAPDAAPLPRLSAPDSIVAWCGTADRAERRSTWLADGPTAGLRLTRDALREGLENDWGAHLEREAELQAEAGTTRDFLTAAVAAAEGGTPVFEGR